MPSSIKCPFCLEDFFENKTAKCILFHTISESTEKDKLFIKYSFAFYTKFGENSAAHEALESAPQFKKLLIKHYTKENHRFIWK